MSKVSVCCSVLNQSAMLRDMIGSVYIQTFKDWELIIVDDGSTEDIKAVIDQFKDSRIHYHRFPENKGIPWGINHAFSLATGDYVQAIAADEVLAPNKLEDQVAYLDANTSIEAIWGLPQNGQIGERPEYEQPALKAHNRSNESWVKTFLELDAVPIGSASGLFRRELLQSVGYFDTSLTAFSDHEWFVRFFREGHKGRLLPYRWALSRGTRGVSQAISPEEVTRQINYVRSKNPQITPPLDKSITVAIPVFNMAHWIGETLESIFAQTVQPTEILIVDDCSTDDLAGALAKYPDPRIKLFRMEENQGNIAGNNLMLSKATGNFLIPLAADDTIAPDFIEKCYRQFQADPWLELVASQTDFMDAKGVTVTAERMGESGIYSSLMSIPAIRNMDRKHMLNILYYGNQYFGVGMYRTSALRDVGGWKRACEVIADYEIYLALLQRYDIRIIEEPLTHTRMHDNNASNLTANKTKRPLKELYAIAKKPYYTPRMKVIIATPFYEMKGWSPYISALAGTIKMLTMLGIEHEFWELSGDSYVARARNTICAKFLEDPETTDLFFIDSDMHWNPEAFVRMLMLPEGVVGGSYPTKNMWTQWTSIPTLKEEDGKVFPVGRPLQDGSALLNAETVSAGFLRLKRHVLEDFRDHYKEHRYKEPGADQSAPDREYIEFFATLREDGLWWGEDRLFCKRLKEMGCDMFIYPNVSMGHYGVKGWIGNYDHFLRGKKDADSTGHRSPGV